MVNAEDYMPRQLNGEFVTMLFEELSRPFADTDSMLKSIYGFKLDNASGENLDYLGQIVGFQRPLLPERVTSSDAFTFLSNDPNQGGDERKSASMGFSSTDNPSGGASMLSVSETKGALLSDAWYRTVLKSYAYLKWNGYNIDSLLYVLKAFFGYDSSAKRYLIYENYGSQRGNLLVCAVGNTEPTRFLLDLVFEDWSYAPEITFTIAETMPTPPTTDTWALWGVWE